MTGMLFIDEYFSEVSESLDSSNGEHGVSEADPQNRLQELDQQILQSPDRADLRNRRGYLLVVLDRVEDAIADFNAAICLDRSLSEAWCNRGYAYLLQDAFLSTKRDTTKALKICPGFAVALQIRGMASAASGNPAEAERDLIAAVEADPDLVASWHSLGTVRTLRAEFSGAISAFDEALTRKPDDSLTLYSRAFALMSSGQLKQAIADLNRALLIDPLSRDALFQRANIHRAQGDFVRAADDHSAALEIDPGFTLARWARSECLTELGQVDAAFDDLTQLIDQDPGSMTAYCGRALILAERGQHSSALDDLNAALALDPDYSSALLARGRSRAELGEHIEGLVDQIDSLRAGGRSADAYRTFAESWLCQDSEFRDVVFARELAQHACELSQWRDWPCIATLAHCCIDTGDRREVVSLVCKAVHEQIIDLADAIRDLNLPRQYVERIRRSLDAFHLP